MVRKSPPKSGIGGTPKGSVFLSTLFAVAPVGAGGMAVPVLGIGGIDAGEGETLPLDGGGGTAIPVLGIGGIAKGAGEGETFFLDGGGGTGTPVTLYGGVAKGLGGVGGGDVTVFGGVWFRLICLVLTDFFPVVVQRCGIVSKYPSVAP